MITIDTSFYEIKVYDRVYHVEFIHSWDETVAKGYIKEVERLIGIHLIAEPWAIVADLTKWTLNTPGAEEMLKKHFEKGLQTQLSCVAGVIEDSKIKEWQARRIAMDNLPENSQIFSDISTALSWVKSLGYIDDLDAVSEKLIQYKAS